MQLIEHFSLRPIRSERERRNATGIANELAVLADVDEMTEEISNALYDGGCSDGTPFSSQGIAAVGFAREAHSLDEAVRSAIADIRRAGFRVARVESPDQPALSRINQELAKP